MRLETLQHPIARTPYISRRCHRFSVLVLRIVLVAFAFQGGVHVALQIWDIGGQSIGSKMMSNYIFGAHVSQHPWSCVRTTTTSKASCRKLLRLCRSILVRQVKLPRLGDHRRFDRNIFLRMVGRSTYDAQSHSLVVGGKEVNARLIRSACWGSVRVL